MVKLRRGADGAAPPVLGISMKQFYLLFRRDTSLASRGLRRHAGSQIERTLYHAWRYGLLYTSELESEPNLHEMPANAIYYQKQKVLRVERYGKHIGENSALRLMPPALSAIKK